VVRLLATFERARFRLTLGMEVPPPPMPHRGSLLRYAVHLLTDASVWRQIAYCIVLLPWGVVAFTATVLAWSVPVAMILTPAYATRRAADFGIWRVDDLQGALAVSLVGAVLLVTVAPNAVRLLSAVDAALGRSLLGSYSSGQLVERVGELEQSRRRVVDAAEAERRRIERDLHDGAQQRLVALAMTLGRAKARLGDDGSPEMRELVEEAHAEAKLAITELRDLTRGLHPPVLSDRGLDAALSALAARSPVPVEVEVDIGVRPTPTVEAIAYFVVAESLTNVARHSGARHASVVVRRVGETLRVVVRDDGMGGADARGGTGLAGVADRIAGVDGRLLLDSPVGGPTVLTVELPCAS